MLGMDEYCRQAGNQRLVHILGAIIRGCGVGGEEAAEGHASVPSQLLFLWGG